jgi:membrane protein
LYSFLPNRRLAWHFGIPGATLVACVWPALQFGFTQYSVHVDFTHVYGALSAPFVILLWFYFVAMLFLFGAELSTAWASVHGTMRVPGDLKETASPKAG